jgi:hypothetical protein
VRVGVNDRRGHPPTYTQTQTHTHTLTLTHSSNLTLHDNNLDRLQMFKTVPYYQVNNEILNKTYNAIVFFFQDGRKNQSQLP